jgi:hypothetical protein
MAMKQVTTAFPCCGFYVRSCPALPCPVMSCHVLSCPVLSLLCCSAVLCLPPSLRVHNICDRPPCVYTALARTLRVHNVYGVSYRQGRLCIAGKQEARPVLDLVLTRSLERMNDVDDTCLCYST